MDDILQVCMHKDIFSIRQVNYNKIAIQLEKHTDTRLADTSRAGS